MQIDALRHVFFLGIGGIGMSALARFCRHRRIRVSGYDKTRTALTDQLVSEGMQVIYADKPGQLKDSDPDVVVYTPAIPVSNRIFQYVRMHDIPVFKRAEFLGKISAGYRTIAIAGTHGKTTISSLLADLLHKGGVSPTAFLGGILAEYSTNFFAGTGEWLIAEADEYDRSFLQLYPEIVILSAMDPDHLDVYGSEMEMQQAYATFLGQISRDGLLLVHHTALRKCAPALLDQLSGKGVQVVTYGLDAGQVRAEHVTVRGHRIHFDFTGTHCRISGLQAAMPGLHNVSNAVAAIEIATRLGVSAEDVKVQFQRFGGIRRRFEYWRRDDDCPVIDDYAHHPEEIRAVIAAARLLYPDRRLTVVFQPHLYTRTRDFAQAFADALSEADEVILIEIYPAREKPIRGVGPDLIRAAMGIENVLVTKKSMLPEVIRQFSPELLMTLGAGDIDQKLPDIVQAIEMNHEKQY